MPSRSGLSRLRHDHALLKTEGTQLFLGMHSLFTGGKGPNLHASFELHRDAGEFEALVQSFGILAIAEHAQLN